MAEKKHQEISAQIKQSGLRLFLPAVQKQLLLSLIIIKANKANYWAKQQSN